MIGTDLIGIALKKFEEKLADSENSRIRARETLLFYIFAPFLFKKLALFEFWMSFLNGNDAKLPKKVMPLERFFSPPRNLITFPLARWQENRQGFLGVRACWYLCMIELIYNYSFVHKDKSITFFTVFEIFHCFPYYDNKFVIVFESFLCIKRCHLQVKELSD